MLGIILLMKQDQFITNQKKMKKGIYGTASNNELRELKEEGIETQEIPWIRNDSN